MRLTSGLGIDSDGPPVKPTSIWKPTKSAQAYAKSAAQETIHFRVLAWAMLLASAVYILAFLRQPIPNDQAWILHIKGYVLLVLMHVVLAYLYNRANNYIDLGASLKRIQTKIPREDSVPVEITIRQNHVVTGFDQGYMWIDEGTLYYKGRQTAFRLNREDLPAASLMPRRERPDLDRRKLPKSLTFPANGRNLTVKIKMIDPFEDFTSRRKAQQFQIDLATWIIGNDESAIESLLPPTQVHPVLVRDGWPRVEPLFGGGFLVAINLILCFAILLGYQQNAVQSGLNQIAAGIHLLLLALSFSIAFRAWNAERLRDGLIREDARQSL